MAETWAVKRRRVDGSFTGNSVFEGTEADARRFISDNYPRVHLEANSPDSGVPDALLVSPDGDYEACVGTQTVGNAVLPQFINTDDKGVPTDDDDDEDDDDDVVDTHDDDDDDETVVETPVEPTAAKKTAAKKTAAPSF